MVSESHTHDSTIPFEMGRGRGEGRAGEGGGGINKKKKNRRNFENLLFLRFTSSCKKSSVQEEESVCTEMGERR